MARDVLDREDLTAQQDAVMKARVDLAAALGHLQGEAKIQQKALASKRGRADLGPLLGLVNEVKRAEEAFDLAVLDLDTASGEDA